MAQEDQEDLVEAATCLLAHGVGQVVGTLEAHAHPDYFDVHDAKVQSVESFGTPDGAARCLVTRLLAEKSSGSDRRLLVS